MKKRRFKEIRKDTETVLIFIPLKGHGNEVDFLGFLHKLDPHRSFVLPFEPFRFCLRFRGDIRHRKTQVGESIRLPNVGKSASLPCPFNVLV